MKFTDLNLTGTNLLVIEDEPDNRDLLVFILEGEGAVVRVAESAQQALEVLEQLKPDVILCDLNLPGQDGCLFMRQWRKREVELGLSPIPALALTALVREQDKQRVREAGFQLHIAKPFDIDQLLQVIVAVIAGNLEEFQYYESFVLPEDISA